MLLALTGKGGGNLCKHRRRCLGQRSIAHAADLNHLQSKCLDLHAIKGLGRQRMVFDQSIAITPLAFNICSSGQFKMTF